MFNEPLLFISTMRWFCKAKVIDWNVVENTIISLIAIYFKTQLYIELEHKKERTRLTEEPES